MLIRAKTIGDAWLEVTQACRSYGYVYKIKSNGKHNGLHRQQLSFLTIQITEPWIRPLATTVIDDTNDREIEKYFDWLISPDNYYGYYISLQLPKVIKMLKSERHNRACITIGDKNSIEMPDPPCFNILDFKIAIRKLNLDVFFRSWDIGRMFFLNLGGFQLLKEKIIRDIDGDIEDGELIVYSSGAHEFFGRTI